MRLLRINMRINTSYWDKNHNKNIHKKSVNLMITGSTWTRLINMTMKSSKSNRYLWIWIMYIIIIITHKEDLKKRTEVHKTPHKKWILLITRALDHPIAISSSNLIVILMWILISRESFKSKRLKLGVCSRRLI